MDSSRIDQRPVTRSSGGTGSTFERLFSRNSTLLIHSVQIYAYSERKELQLYCKETVNEA